MALKFVRWSVIAGAAIFILVNPAAIYSCGPYLEEAVFVQGAEPQVSQQDFAAGKLGVVIPTLRRSYLVVAYRYLSGLPLESKYQQEAIDVWNRKVGSSPDDAENDGTRIWSEARRKVAGVPEVTDYDIYAPYANSPYERFLNCPKDAFGAAAVTLTARIQKYSADSAAVRDWVIAQDQVFKNCGGKAQLIPAALDAKDSLLRADRSYQMAAAEFYAQKFDDAASSFDAIAKDAQSPWSAMSSYLAARALVRKANLSTGEGSFDAAMMKAAQQRLEQILNDTKLEAMHDAAQRLLDYIRFRTEPTQRAAELEQVMMKADPGAGFRQHFWDYALFLSRGIHSADLSDWLQNVYMDWDVQHSPLQYKKDEAQHALAKWREQHSLPWLIAALQWTQPGDSNASELLNAAKAVAAGSPGYLTVRYHALRLMALTSPDEARKELDALLARPTGELAAGTRNLFNDERQKLVTSFPDFLAHASETPSVVGYDYNGLEEGTAASLEPAKSPSDALFNAYSAKVLSHYLPVSFLLQAAQSSSVPNSLRRELARSTWTRAILLGDLATANQLQPVLEQLDHPLWKSMEPFRAASADSDKHLAAILVILNNPGLAPSVRTGILRTATLGEIDNYRDNWWCEERTDHGPDASALPFLSSADKEKASQEQEKLAQTVTAPNYLTSEVLAYAAQNQKNPLVPQALHLSVRATRYGCTTSETTYWSQKAFQLLHKQYPESEWTKKTKYHF